MSSKGMCEKQKKRWAAIKGMCENKNQVLLKRCSKQKIEVNNKGMCEKKQVSIKGMCGKKGQIVKNKTHTRRKHLLKKAHVILTTINFYKYWPSKNRFISSKNEIMLSRKYFF